MKPAIPDRLGASGTEGGAASRGAIEELLDHLAEELAREYVRLMEAAAKADAAPGPVGRKGEGR